jgi:hypothetical protein
MSIIATANRPGAVARYIGGVIVATTTVSTTVVALWYQGLGYAGALLIPIGAAVFVTAVNLSTQRASDEPRVPASSPLAAANPHLAANGRDILGPARR